MDRKVRDVSRDNYPDHPIKLPPGRYRLFGFPPMTGLALDKWIEIDASNSLGCYGPADIPVHRAIPNITRIENEHGTTIWPRQQCVENP
ncbi:MAG: hypothetical protein CMP23_12285 [Rickettsiales bacterium]|nr:hypothetical protein [Rickettsiales bacterium]